MSTPDAEAREAYAHAFAAVKSELPQLDALRQGAIDGLEFPVRRSEAWRFTSARTLIRETHPCRYGAFSELPEGVLGLDVLDTPAGKHLGRVASHEGFAGLNAAFFREVAAVVVPQGQKRNVRLAASHQGLSTPRVLVVAESDSDTELYLHHTVAAGLAVPVVEIVALPGARVSVTHVVEGASGHFAGLIAVEAGHGSEVAVQSVLAGADIARLDITASLGASSHFDSSGLVLGKGKAHYDHHLNLHHSDHGAVSNQLFRNVLDEASRAVFTGEVHVERDITKSDATQSANTLLLSDDSSAVARPWLVIDNDDVKASHGATVGRLDPDSLFYLRSRGIGALDARRLLMRAFAGEVVLTVPEGFRDEVQAVVERYVDGRES